MTQPVGTIIHELARFAEIEVNQQIGAPEWKDQSAGNQCHALTHTVMQALQLRGYEVGRELHRDHNDNWHYLLRHSSPESTPTSEDFVTDMNPWQWAHDLSKGKGILHASREEVMDTLATAGAPDFFVALRSLKTVVKPHEPRLNFGGHA